ncbi:MAG: TrpB-like pyridoxal phosphate-dependent enzyme [Candidatus Goldiibacteriota bacterium]
MNQVKFLLNEKDMPNAWYNILPDLPRPIDPYLHPGTMKPIGPEDLAPLFPMECIKQEVSAENWIDIPGEVLDIYRLWRPSPLYRAYSLEKALDTPAKIYYKYEGVSPAGSHKPNTAIAQAYYNKKEGVKRIATETGAGQWGSALSLAGALLGIDIEVYMVRVSYDQKPYRKLMMETWGGQVFASPTDRTDIGKKILAEDPDSPGSLGIAISEAVEVAAKNEDTKYSLGSVLNHVMLHQTIIGLEAKKQMEMAGDYPDVILAACGGGSNFSGISFPFLQDKLKSGKTDLRVVAVEPSACPTLTRGAYAYDFGDTGEMAPIAKMFTLGHKFIPAGIHAGGLRYHGDSPIVSLLHKEKVIEAMALDQVPCFQSAILFSKTEGIIPAPESSHAIHGAVIEALKAKESGEKKTILFNLSGHGNFDFAAYENYLSGNLKDTPLTQESVDKGLTSLPKIPE